MKELFPKRGGSQSTDKDSLPSRKSSKTELQNFLDRVASMPKGVESAAGGARLVFALDATASRQLTWDRSTRLQGEMFVSAQALGGLQVQLCYFRGLAEFFASEWQVNSDSLLRIMSGIQCHAGMTQIERLLRHVLAENGERKVRGVIYIGDAMEENPEQLCQLAGKLGILNVPLFMFQEREDPLVRQTFMQMARLSGGAYCQFDGSSASQLRDLLRAVAMYAAGGLKALEDFSKSSHESVKLLGQQLK